MCLIHLLHLQKNVVSHAPRKISAIGSFFMRHGGIYNDLNDDGTGFHQQHHKWLGNNHRISEPPYL